MTPLYKILSISAICAISASKMFAQGRSLAFSSDVGAAYAQTGEKFAISQNQDLRPNTYVITMIHAMKTI
jgi:hypothetical protein